MVNFLNITVDFIDKLRAFRVFLASGHKGFQPTVISLTSLRPKILYRKYLNA